MKAVEARAGELVVLITDTGGAAISIVDTPVVGWITDETGATPSRPVTLWPLTPRWAKVEVKPSTSPRA
jgi:hypothetical protein